MAERTVYLATRGSALAVAQTNLVMGQCRAAFPDLSFEIKIIKTTGDKLQTASLADAKLPKGLFTKELEVALLNEEADLAVHSLKDLPTALPAGLKLGAAGKRADPRDVLIHRAADGFGTRIADLPKAATVATSSTRRSAQLLEQRPDLNIVPIRGNVGTRLSKLATQPQISAIVLAAAGLERLGFDIMPSGLLCGEGVADGLVASLIHPADMLPCVGQAALGIEVRENDPLAARLCEALNDFTTMQCIRAEREFLRAMGGGCQIPVAGYAEADGSDLKMRAVSFLNAAPRRAEGRGPLDDPEGLGSRLAKEIQMDSDAVVS
jgi:hydroxymethylbilane synthase